MKVLLHKKNQKHSTRILNYIQVTSYSIRSDNIVLPRVHAILSLSQNLNFLKKFQFLFIFPKCVEMTAGEALISKAPRLKQEN